MRAGPKMYPSRTRETPGVAVAGNTIARLQGFYAIPLTDSTVDPLLTILGSRQLVATHGNGFRPTGSLKQASSGGKRGESLRLIRQQMEAVAEQLRRGVDQCWQRNVVSESRPSSDGST